jgi:hypothetical protein
MSSLLKSTALTLGLLGIAAAAQAQSVSSLPPQSGPSQSSVTGGVTPASPPPVTPSAPLVGPKPGGGAVWQEEHYQPAPNYDADKTQHPYSTPIGPKPGSYSSGPEEHYQATDRDALPGRHPYTMPGVGPRPGG